MTETRRAGRHFIKSLAAADNLVGAGKSVQEAFSAAFNDDDWTVLYLAARKSAFEIDAVAYERHNKKEPR